MKYYVGVDLGGTNVRVAKVDEEGKIVYDLSAPSYGQEGPREKVTQIIIELLKTVPELSLCEGIGIGVPGPVDTKRKVMTMSTNLVGWTDYPIADILEQEFNLPVYIDNDANVAGLAEAFFGSGKDEDIVYYLTHSTGIGGALVVNKRVVSGKRGYAGEVGNIIVKRDGKKYNHLNAGAIENEASGTALNRKALELTAYHNAKELFEHHEEPLCQKIIDEMAFDLAQLLQAIAHVVDPGVFVIGGGVSHSWELYYPKLRKYFDEMVHPPMRNIRIERAALKEPGVLGAAMLVKR